VLVIDGVARLAVEPLSFAVKRGELVAVDGPSGSGKTTLLRAIADLDPSEGDVRLDGVSRASMTGPAWRRAVVYVAGEPSWWGERIRDHFRDPGKAGRVLEAMGLDRAAIDWPVARLSTGEAQRVALARALVLDSPVLLLDEPTANLDPSARDRVERLLREAASAGTHIVFVSHDGEQRRRLADRVVSIARGSPRTAAGASDAQDPS
jgi:ABC-type multidrug transport system ATPase subunit